MSRSVAFGWLFALGAALCGCATDYAWRPSVPQEMRTVAVPTFRNESEVAELGAHMARQLRREFQREGTFAVRAAGDAALEVQGVVKAASCGMKAYDRRIRGRIAAYDFVAVAEVSVIDKRDRKVLVDNRTYRVEESLTTGQDMATAMRDASGRLADALAHQVVSDVLNLKW